MKIGFISLGCAKNLVDSEFVLGMLQASEVDIVHDPEEADIIFINTCGFIEAAREETIATIHEMHQYGKKLVVMGCYAERYRAQIMAQMPFIDHVIPLSDYPRLHQVLAKIFAPSQTTFFPLSYQRRLLTAGPYAPYVKISEGCDNRCTYCAIPLIRGPFRSRPEQEIIDECRWLISHGAKEINLVSQDTTRYGRDLSGGESIVRLLERICQMEGLFLVRLLYLYPEEISEDLLRLIERQPKIARYFDIPVQHIADPVLKRMHRRGSSVEISALIDRIRSLMPDAVIRTTLIVGFPGESEADFRLLEEFVKLKRFDRLGVFAYSPEEDTLAKDYPDQIDEATKSLRKERIMLLQRRISQENHHRQKNRVHTTLIEHYDPESEYYYGRSYAFAPDDVDGYIVFQSHKQHAIGDIVNVRITDTNAYDLLGNVQDEVEP